MESRSFVSIFNRRGDVCILGKVVITGNVHRRPIPFEETMREKGDSRRSYQSRHFRAEAAG